MDNKQVLEFILKSDELLNQYGKVSKIIKKGDKKRALQEIFKQAHFMQRQCYDPYLYATKDLNSDEVENTCLVCGRVVKGKNLGHVVNLGENGLIEGDDVEEFAVSKLKEYLQQVPFLGEEEIREALKKDIMEYSKTR